MTSSGDPVSGIALPLVAWVDFLEQLAELRQMPDFDEQERFYKLKIAEGVNDVLRHAQDGGDLIVELQAAFHGRYDGEVYNLTNWRQNEWLIDWTRQDVGSVREALSGFLRSDRDARARFDAFSLAADRAELSGLAQRNRAATLAFGSLFNFAVEPLVLPLVRSRVFAAAERAVDMRLPAGSSLPEEYGHHLAFAEETARRLRASGVPIRDMVDVQSLVFLFSNRPRDDQATVTADSASTSSDARVWCIRAGEQGQYESLALKHDVAVIGWHDLGPLTRELSRDDLKTMIGQVFGETKPGSLAMGAGQIFRFIHDVSVGDLVVLPLKSNPGHVAVARVLGEYEYRNDGEFESADAQNTRPVEWLARDLSYERFDPALRKGFSQQGTISEISKLDAVRKILDVLDGADWSAVDLVVKWSEKFGANTVEEHRQLADKRGAVWWGLIGSPDKPKLAEKWFDKIRAQLEAQHETRVFISGPSCWTTTLREIAGPNDVIDPDLVPAYYPSEFEHSLWVKLANFEPVDRSWLTGNLELVSAPGKPLSEGALSNQTNPLIVRVAASASAQTRRVWWVCQGITYASARDLGVLWAPKTAKDGSGRAFWRALQDAHVGDLVLHYAEGQLRAVSTVTDEAVDSPSPGGLSADWSGVDGWLVRAEYRELGSPISLSEIPADLRIAEQGPFTKQGSVQQGYFFALSDRFVNELAGLFPELGLQSIDDGGPAVISYSEPSLESISAAIAEVGLSISSRSLRRYHVSLKTRGFVVLAGVSGSGKTWLAEAYADAVGAEQLRVPVAPNWTTNEDLLGYLNPIDGAYRHTDFSRFLQRAAAEYSAAEGAEREPRPFHLILDELNLARVEYYFAKFLSAMEARARYGTAPIVLAEGLEAQLTPNLKFIGTVNVDETTFGFADKVYDRAQLIELDAPWAALAEHMKGKPFEDTLRIAWEAVHEIAPFAFRIVDEVNAYVDASGLLGVGWEEAVDDQLLQKVLPKVKGSDPRLRGALEALVELTETSFPLSHTKAQTMLDMFNTHGFVSYF